MRVAKPQEEFPQHFKPHSPETFHLYIPFLSLSRSSSSLFAPSFSYFVPSTAATVPHLT